MQPRNEKKAGVLLTYFNIAIGFVIPLLYTPIMLRLLGQAEYGLYGLSASVINYLGLLSLGLGSAIVRYLMQCRAKGEADQFQAMAGLFLLLYSIIAVVALGIGIGLTHFTGSWFGKGLSQAEITKLNTLLVIMSVGTFLSFISSVYTSFITCFERYLFLRLLAVVNTLTTPLLNLAVLYLGMASTGLALVSVALQGITCVIYIFYSRNILGIRPTFRHLPFHKLKGIFRYSAFVFIGLIADMLYWATDKVLIGAMMGTVAVAVYNVGGTFQGILQNMSSAISNVFTPEVNRCVVEERPVEVLSSLLIRIGRVQYLIVSLVLSGFTVFGRTFIRLWAGPNYSEAYLVAMLTMVPLAIPLIQSIAFTIIKAQGTHRFRSVLYAILAVANAVSTFFLIPVMGIVGAALCTCVVFVLGHGIIMNIYYWRVTRLDIPAFWKNIGKMSVVPGAMILVGIWLVKNVLPMTSLWWFLGWVIVYTAIFAVLSWIFSMNRYEKDLVLGLLKNLLPKRKTS